MFPGVNGFHFTAIHLIFLGVFFAVVAIIGVTLVTALLRTWRTFREGKQEQVRWHSDFHDLPHAERACRHALTGEMKNRTCERGFDCRGCGQHAALIACKPSEPGETEILGLPYPDDRFYHRGHTWAKPEPDGTMVIGLDEIGRRLIGAPDALELPAAGSKLEANGTAWRLRKGGSAVRVLSPVDGEVVESSNGEAGWFLRVKPRDGNLIHLLTGSEVRSWVLREMERLQLAIPRHGMAASLADGGVLVEDVASNLPANDLDAVLGKMFLEP